MDKLPALRGFNPRVCCMTGVSTCFEVKFQHFTDDNVIWLRDVANKQPTTTCLEKIDKNHLKQCNYCYLNTQFNSVDVPANE